MKHLRHLILSVSLLVALPLPRALAQDAADPVQTRKQGALKVIWQEGEGFPAGSDNRLKLRQEFLTESAAFVQSYPSNKSVWLLRAIAAVELNSPTVGREAARKLLAFGLDKSTEPSIQDVFAKLERKKWLTEADPAQEKASKGLALEIAELEQTYRESQAMSDRSLRAKKLIALIDRPLFSPLSGASGEEKYWLIRGIISLDMNHGIHGWQAGKKLSKFYDNAPSDTLSQVLVQMKKRGWLVETEEQLKVNLIKPWLGNWETSSQIKGVVTKGMWSGNNRIESSYATSKLQLTLQKKDSGISIILSENLYWSYDYKRSSEEGRLCSESTSISISAPGKYEKKDMCDSSGYYSKEHKTMFKREVFENPGSLLENLTSSSYKFEDGYRKLIFSCKYQKQSYERDLFYDHQTDTIRFSEDTLSGSEPSSQIESGQFSPRFIVNYLNRTK